MLVEQIAVNNSLRNYMYLLACPETREAVAIDPLDHAVLLQRANELGWSIRGVINSHEHHDHIGGNGPVISATGATLYAHHQAVDKIPNVDVALRAGDAIQVGTSVELIALDTPGHTFCHSCFYFLGNDQQAPALFSGDTLFNAGVGNCHNGGNPQTLYQTFVQQIFVLPDETMVYPGHDYIENNLEFTLDREPNNAAAQSLLAAIKQWPGDKHFISNIGMERLVNTFFRLQSEELIARLRSQFPNLPNDDPEAVFVGLRELRNKW
ncbi:hydroxyacylglutathione hydrolase [Arenicella xantha]|uniref:Hydroxyacylglutathione hydrolase n=1 Tax=Arenicella xantha TaxID=644221 RepID=A0A395JH51_9GAMM|nr:hydroxyacylglutathione hydrolase [Arenicella xantha]RBP48869.1 hydroxyacylglutathione hydrolase [Arenicella xantha]